MLRACLVAVLLVCSAVAMEARAFPVCVAAGAPAEVRLFPGRTAWYRGEIAYLNSATIYTRSGNTRRDLYVTLTLPESEPTGRFLDGSRSIRLFVDQTCGVSVPPIQLGMTPGTIPVQVQTDGPAGTQFSTTFSLAVQSPPATFKLYSGEDRIVASASPGHTFSLRAGTQVMDAEDHGWPGTAVTFTLPADGPGATFLDGSRTATVVTGYNGGVTAPPMISNGVVGAFAVKATATGAVKDASFGKFLNLGEIRVRMEAATSDGPFPQPSYVQGSVRFEGFPCATSYWSGLAPFRTDGPPVMLTSNGRPVGYAVAEAINPTTDCEDGSLVLRYSGPEVDLAFGTHQLAYEFEGTDALARTVSANTVTVTSRPAATGTTTVGSIGWKAGLLPNVDCHPNILSLPAGEMPPAPATHRFPLGAIKYFQDSGCGATAPYMNQRMVFDFDVPLPPEATVMWYGTLEGDVSAGWHTLPSSVSGNRVLVAIGTEDSSFRAARAGIIAVAVPQPGFGVGNYQDLWWGGTQQNGWGVGIAQHRDQLFVTIFGYDTAGAPRWWVVTGGTWSADKRVFTGAVYQPKMVYGGSQPFQIGAPLGNVSLEFSDGSHGALRYTMGNLSGEKAIERQPLGEPGPAVHTSRADMWWYSDANRYGEGVFIAQQAATIFAVRYGYDSPGGLTHWDFLPGGMWTSRTRFVSGLYEARGSDWLRAYDPSALQVTWKNEASLTFEFVAGEYPDGAAQLFSGCTVTVDYWGCDEDKIVPQPF